MPEFEKQREMAREALARFRAQVEVLIVDDEESLRGLISETIKESGLKTDTAASAEEALEKFKTKGIHLVLTDIRMAGMSGIELLEKIKAGYPETEVVIMTSHASMDTAISAIRAGAYDYLMKPFNNLDDVITLINRAVDKIFLRYENQRLMQELADKNQKLTEMNRETKTLYNFSNFMTQSLDINEVKEKALSCFRDLSGGMSTIFLAYVQGKLVLSDTAPPEYIGDRKNKAIVSLEKMSLEDIIVWLRRINQEPVFQKTMTLYFQTGSFYASPIVVENAPYGVLVSLNQDGTEFPQKMARLLHQFSQIVVVAVEKAQLHRQMKEFAIKDGLTALFNHRYFQERIASEVMRADRHPTKISLLFVDVDHFKKFNDTNGHPMGDMVLKGVASIISTRARKTDIVARYGGEEFVVILPDTPKEGAMEMAEGLRRSIESHPFPGGEKQPLGRVSVSLGVAEFPRDAKDVKTLIAAADSALYYSKHNGRNRVTAFEPHLLVESEKAAKLPENAAAQL